MKPRLPIFSFVLLLLFVKTCPVFCQQIIFNKVLPPNGKTFSHVTSIVQDKQGYMWLATHHGLYRYDGYQMISYKNDPKNPASLADNRLESVCADSSGIIWIGTFGEGLDRFDPASGTFRHFRHNAKDENLKLTNKIF